MTIPDALKPLLIKGAVVLAIVFGAVAVWNHQHRALTDARRALEASELERKGLIVSHEKTVAGLNEKIAAMAKDPRLAAALAEAKAAAPFAKATQAGTYSTGVVAVKATPESRPPPQAVESTDRNISGNNFQPIPATQTCVLSDGDQASIAVDVVTFETKLGNTFVVGVATAWRETPAPRTQLFGGKFQSALSEVSGLAPPSLPRWGAGLAAACLGFCAAGPAVAFPPLRILGLQIETTLAGLVSDRGAGGSATAIFRW